MTDGPRVTVAGGGLAGIAAALRLAQRGYEVKLYEQKTELGGNLASRPSPGGVALDVYPHMFLSWYHNFWAMLRDAGVNRDAAFTPIDSAKQLRRGEYPSFTTTTNGYSPRHMFENLFSGVGPPADMFLFWYSTVDLLAERLNPTMRLDDVSVMGFMQARPYITTRAAKAADNFITMVWAIPAYQASAEDYREYLAYSVSSYNPPCLLAKDSAAETMIGPLATAMERAGVEIVLGTGVTSVSAANGRVTEIELKRGDEKWTEQVDELILAVPPHTLSTLVRTGEPGHRVVEAAPNLAQLSRLRSQQIPILHVYFTRKLPNMPAEPVGLYDSRQALAFTDISMTWKDVPAFAGRTVLSVSASDPFALPGTGDRDDAFSILTELAEYVDFNPGYTWGESHDIDWQLTSYDSNMDSQLFINEIGVDVWRPPAACSGVVNLSFAGNFCRNRIGMMTVESAVASGLEAARVIVERRGLGDPVHVIEPKADRDLVALWFRYTYGPSAYMAKAWSTGTDMLHGVRRALAQRRES
jgi:glycine/D-amino acid oxidase-like deaminating enzyme